MGDVEALINSLGEEIALGLKSGDLRAILVNGSVQIHKVLKALFDKNGRRIPLNLKSPVCDPESEVSFRLDDLSYQMRYQMFTEFISDMIISVDYFKRRTEVLLLKLESDHQLKNILKSTHFPIIIPQIPRGDYWNQSEIFFKNAELPFNKKYPDCKFQYKAENQSEFGFASERNQQLLQMIRNHPVVALFFPASLKGFSITAQREQMESLPNEFVLSGPLEAAIAMNMYPEVFSQDNYIPYLTCAGMWTGESRGAYEISHRQRFTWVELYKDLKKADGERSGGLLYLGTE